jgi:hypothetical protein
VKRVKKNLVKRLDRSFSPNPTVWYLAKASRLRYQREALQYYGLGLDWFRIPTKDP